MAKRARKSPDGDLLALCERWHALRLAPETSPASYLAAPSEAEQVLALIAVASPLTTTGVAAMLAVADALPEDRLLTASQIRAAAMRALQEREVYVGDPWAPNAPPPPLAPAEIDFKGAPYRRGPTGDAFRRELARLDAIDDRHSVDMAAATAEIADLYALPHGQIRQQLERGMGLYVVEAMKLRENVAAGYIPLRAPDVEAPLLELESSLRASRMRVLQALLSVGSQDDSPPARHAARRAQDALSVVRVDRERAGHEVSDIPRLLGEIDCVLEECAAARSHIGAKMQREGTRKGGDLRDVPWLSVLAEGLYLVLEGAGLRFKAPKRKAGEDPKNPRPFPPRLSHLLAIVHSHLPPDCQLGDDTLASTQRGLDELFDFAAFHAARRLK